MKSRGKNITLTTSLSTLSSQKAALAQNFPSQPQTRCPKAKPGALISLCFFFSFSPSRLLSLN